MKVAVPGRMPIVCASTLGADERKASLATAALARALGEEVHLVHVVSELGAG